MIQKGDHFRRQLDGSSWEIAAISQETLKPSDSATAVLVPADGGASRQEVPIAYLEKEIGWKRL